MAVPHMCVCGGGAIPPAPVAPPPVQKNTDGFNPLSINLGDRVPAGGQVTYGYIVTVPPQSLNKLTAKSNQSLGRSSVQAIKPQKQRSINDLMNDARKCMENYKRIQESKGLKVDLTGKVADIIKKAEKSVEEYESKNKNKAKSLSRLPSGGAEKAISNIEYEPQAQVQRLVVVPEPYPLAPPKSSSTMVGGSSFVHRVGNSKVIVNEDEGNGQDGVDPGGPPMYISIKSSREKKPIIEVHVSGEDEFKSLLDDSQCSSARAPAAQTSGRVSAQYRSPPSNKGLPLESASIADDVNNLFNNVPPGESPIKGLQDILYFEVQPVQL